MVIEQVVGVLAYRTYRVCRMDASERAGPLAEILRYRAHASRCLADVEYGWWTQCPAKRRHKQCTRPADGAQKPLNQSLYASWHITK